MTRGSNKILPVVSEMDRRAEYRHHQGKQISVRLSETLSDEKTV
jgi:hypothetical protein